MKFLLILLLAPVLLIAQGDAFILKGKVGTLDAPARIFLKYRTGKTSVVDSAVLHKGSFMFKGKVAEVENATLTLQQAPALAGTNAGRQDVLWLYLEKGTITVSAPDSISKAIVSGSITNDYSRKLKAILKPVDIKMQQLRVSSRAASPEEKSSGKWQKFQEEAEKERRQLQLAFIQSNPNTIVSLEAIQDYAGYFPDAGVVGPLYNLLSARVKGTQKGQEYAAVIEGLKLTLVGAMAPLFVQNDPEGKPVKLTDFRGKYVLLDFWSSWCKPCRAENPVIVKAYNKYKDKNFTILGVSLDNKNTSGAWLKAIADDQLTWTHVADIINWQNAVADQYRVNAIPQNFLIDPQGRIVAKNLHGEELDKKLAELLM